MIKKIRRKIISETKQIALIVERTTATAESDFRCELCGEASAMISPLPAAKLLRTGTREIYRFLESGKVHFIETADKQIFICAASLKEIYGQDYSE